MAKADAAVRCPKYVRRRIYTDVDKSTPTRYTDNTAFINWWKIIWHAQRTVYILRPLYDTLALQDKYTAVVAFGRGWLLRATCKPTLKACSQHINWAKLNSSLWNSVHVEYVCWELTEHLYSRLWLRCSQSSLYPVRISIRCIHFVSY